MIMKFLRIRYGNSVGCVDEYVLQLINAHTDFIGKSLHVPDYEYF